MWRGISVRQLALLILGPMLVETVWSLLLFWMGVQTTLMGYPPKVQNIVILLPAVGYAVSAFAAGLWVTPRIARKLLWLMILVCMGLGLAAIYFRSFALFVAVGPIMGACIGHYYVPFQINLGDVKPFHTLAWTIACYNLAWGTGAALGPLIVGLTEHRPTSHLVWTVLGLTALHTLLVYIAVTAPPPVGEHHPTAAFASTPLQRKLGWAGFGVAGLMIRGVTFTLIPAFAEARHWTGGQKGIVVFAGFAMVPLGAMLCAKLRNHLVRPWIMVGSLVIGAAGMATMPWFEAWAISLTCMIGVGIGESISVYHMLYYGNADPGRRGRSISIGEMIAGVGAVVGPAFLGLLAWNDATSWRPWCIGAAAMLAVAAWISWTWNRKRDRILFSCS